MLLSQQNGSSNRQEAVQARLEIKQQFLPRPLLLSLPHPWAPFESLNKALVKKKKKQKTPLEQQTQAWLRVALGSAFQKTPKPRERSREGVRQASWAVCPGGPSRDAPAPRHPPWLVSCKFPTGQSSESRGGRAWGGFPGRGCKLPSPRPGALRSAACFSKVLDSTLGPPRQPPDFCPGPGNVAPKHSEALHAPAQGRPGTGGKAAARSARLRACWCLQKAHGRARQLHSGARCCCSEKEGNK